MNKKYTLEEFWKLSKEERREAIINFTAPDRIHQPKEKYNRSLDFQKG